MTRQLPSAEDLRKVFTYNPDTGKLYWNIRNDVPKYVNTRFAGMEAGSPFSGRLQVRLNGISYLVHRIIWVIMLGDVLNPKDDIDHKDLNGFNNEWNNLRIATRSQNIANRNMQINNDFGIKCIDKLPGGSYRVRIAGVHLCCCTTIEEAVEVYNIAATKLYGEYGRLILLPM